jgi:hypothetical protein
MARPYADAKPVKQVPTSVPLVLHRWATLAYQLTIHELLHTRHTLCWSLASLRLGT